MISIEDRSKTNNKAKELPILNLDKGYPNVLFAGSGLCYSEDYKWTAIIENIAENKDNVSMLKAGNSSSFQLPNTVLAYSLASVDDNKRHDSYIDAFKNYEHKPNDIIKNLLGLPFDAILTTNYTYEFECAQKRDYYSLKSKLKYANCTEKDNKYLIHTYNQINKGIPIWHIHGELRRKTSMILSHDEYARLIQNILNFNTKRGNYYEENRNHLKVKSWIDYFLVGNIYFLGYSLDFSEFDIWWLLNRRLRENTEIGKVYFYDPINSDKNNIYKHEALKMRGVNVETLNFTVTNNNYTNFYASAVNDIKEKIQNEAF